MTRQEAIARAAADVATAADFTRVGTEDIFGDPITAEQIVDSVQAAINRLQSILGKTDAEWAKLWADSEATEQAVEDAAWRFAAGKE